MRQEVLATQSWNTRGGQKLRVERRTKEDNRGEEKGCCWRLGAQRKGQGQEGTSQGGLGNGTRGQLRDCVHDLTGTMSKERGLLQL